jgi:MscS family membrane protein
VVGFLAAARDGTYEIARQYLNVRTSNESAQDLSRQLSVVLDARLPARLRQLSGAPEGSRSNPLKPDQEVVGTIESSQGDVEVVLERVPRQGSEPIWLFSRATVDAVPALYEEVSQSWGAEYLPRFLYVWRLGGIRLFEWVAVLVGLPIVYLLTVLLNKILTPLLRALWRRIARDPNRITRDALPMPVRLVILAIAIHWFVASVPLPLLVRQFWSSVANLLTIPAIAWMLIFLNGEVERSVGRRLPPANLSAATALVRLVRRVVDVLVVFGALLATFRYFGINPTPALAGLGVGGIAVALAAQKTLENVIAGASLIFDNAVRVGDFLKMGDVQGTVDHIGLRSTRIRTPDRTVVSIPNSQIASVSLETISARDKFWFHPIVGLRYETTSTQLRAVIDGIRRLLVEHPSADHESVRVRFLRMGPFSLDIEVSAYVLAGNWDHFLEIQEQLLFGVTEIVEAAGTRIALPSQTMYVAEGREAEVEAEAQNARGLRTSRVEPPVTGR